MKIFVRKLNYMKMYMLYNIRGQSYYHTKMMSGKFVYD